MKKTPTRYLALGLFGLFLSASPGRVMSYDVAIRTAIAHSLWTQGSVFVPPGSGVEPGLVDTPQGKTTFYGVGQSLVLIPFDILTAVLARALPGNWAHLPIAFVYVPLMGLFWFWALALLLRQQGFPRQASRLGAAAFSLCTVVFVYSSQTAQEESLVGCLVLTATALWLRACRAGKATPAVLAGLAAAFALLVRLNSALALIPLLGIVLDAAKRPSRKRLGRLAVWATVGALPPLALTGLFAWMRFGSVFATGYDAAARQGLGVFFTSFQKDVFWGLWLGWGKGLLVLSPVLLLSAYGWTRAWRRRPWFCSSIALSFLASTLLCACIYNNPDGSESWGARYQVHLIGLAAFAALLGFARVERAGWHWLRGLWVLGACFQIAACLAPDSLEYTQSDALPQSRTRLITGVSTGQLGLRLHNLQTWARGKTAAEHPAVQQMESEYVPNIWGFACRHKITSAAVGFAALFLWALVFFASLRIVASALLPRPRLLFPSGMRYAPSY